MNKIYKVIFNKAKGCYQVASEFAHQQGRSGSTKTAVGRMAAVLAVTALLGSVSVQAQVTDEQFANLKNQVNALQSAQQGNVKYFYDTAKDQYTNKAQVGIMEAQKYTFVNDKGQFQADFTLQDLQEATRAGLKAGMVRLDKGQIHSVTTAEDNKNEVVLGNDASAKGWGSISIGQNSHAEQNSVVLGSNAQVKNNGTVAIGASAQGGNSANQAVAVGYNSYVGRVGGVALGANSYSNVANEVSVGHKKGDVINGTKQTDDLFRKITNVADGQDDNDAVNVSQLTDVKTIANKGWNLSTGNVATDATQIKPGDMVDFSGDKNISISHDNANVKVTLNQNIDVNYVQTNALNSKYNLSVGPVGSDGKTGFFVNSNGAFSGAKGNFVVDKDGGVTAVSGDIGNVTLNNGVVYKNSALRDGELYVGDADSNYSQITSKNAKLGKVMIDNNGQISGVAAGTVTADSTDAVNGSQLYAVQREAGKHTAVANGSNINVEEINNDGQKTYKVGLNKDILLGDVTGKNVSISGTNGTIETTGFIATKDRVLADKGAKLADLDITGDAISNGPSKVVLNEGYAGIAYGDTSIALMPDTVILNGKVSVDKTGVISGVAAGRIAADSTDAVNGSQLHKVQQEAGKHTKIVNGSNINVEEIDNDGQKTYKVGLNKDILLGDVTGKNVSISGTNGTIETTGFIATKDRVLADKGAKLADVDINGDTISNSKSSVKLGKDGTVTVNDKVTIDGNGKVSGVAKGEISNTSTDAVNGSQLQETNDRVSKVENDVKNIKGDITNIKGDIKNIKGDITTIQDNVTDLDNRVTEVEKTAGKHSSVSTNDSNLNITEGTNAAGGKDYKVSLNKDLQLNSVTTGDTKMDTKGVTVGDKVSLTKDGLMVGDTKITNDGLSIGDKTYVSKDGLNANNQTITNVADGKVEKGSTDAVNGGQLYETNQAIANNATNISSLSHSLSNLDNRVNKVGAGAAALAALHPLDFDPDAKWDFAAGYGNYRGTNAAAVGAYYRPNEDTMLSVGGTFGNGENMVNAGVSFKLGAGSSHVSTSRVAMAKEIKELRSEVEAMKSAVLDANAGKKVDTSKLQLFPDVPQNHWAYEYVAQLAGNGMIEGYPDGNFAGDRPMTRYEFAAVLYRAMTKGAVLSDKILSEFSHELEYFTVDTVAKDKAGNPTIQRVRTVKANKNK